MPRGILSKAFFYFSRSWVYR